MYSRPAPPAQWMASSRPVAHYVERANGREKIMEWHGGDVTGVLPYSRLAASPGDSIVEIPSEIVIIRREDLSALIRECHAFTSALVHVMLDRARHFTSNDLLADKMASLGLAGRGPRPASRRVARRGGAQRKRSAGVAF